MAKDSVIDNLREESALRKQRLQQAWNVFMPFRGKGFLVASTTTEGDDDGFLLPGEGCGM